MRGDNVQMNRRAIVFDSHARWYAVAPLHNVCWVNLFCFPLYCKCNIFFCLACCIGLMHGSWQANSRLELKACTFSENKAGEAGGVMLAEVSNIKCKLCYEVFVHQCQLMYKRVDRLLSTEPVNTKNANWNDYVVRCATGNKAESFWFWKCKVGNVLN